ncbi:MAG: hypothetical protein NZ555_11215 [Geminicoccaceae bacterium]|nr:hypothetical protein [Geminicoccaceae bacterium]
MMGAWQLAALLHLVVAIFFVGYLLFWAILALALGRDRGPAEVERHLAVAAAARWPHVLVPWKLRLPLPVVGWLLLALAVGSGVLAGAASGSSHLGFAFWLKLAAVGLLFAVHLPLARRPRALWAWVALPVALLVVVLSVPLVR